MVNNTMDALEWLRKQLDGDENDLLREMVREFAQRLMAPEVDALNGAGWGEVSAERVNHRNGYRQRPFDTRVGSIELAIPKLRRGSYFPDWLLDPRRRAEKALVAVVAECYVRGGGGGGGTRRVDGLVKTLGIESLSKSQVSRMASELDEMVTEFRNRPLDAGPYTYVWMDALTQKVREGGRIINVASRPPEPATPADSWLARSTVGSERHTEPNAWKGTFDARGACDTADVPRLKAQPVFTLPRWFWMTNWVVASLEMQWAASVPLRNLRPGVALAGSVVALMVFFVGYFGVLRLPRRWAWKVCIGLQALVVAALAVRAFTRPAALLFLVAPVVGLGLLASPMARRFYLAEDPGRRSRARDARRQASAKP